MTNLVKVKNSGFVPASFQDFSGKELLSGRIILPYVKTGDYRIAFTQSGSAKKTHSVACEILQNPSSLGILTKIYYSLFFKELTVIIGGKETQIFINKRSLKKQLNKNTLSRVASLSQYKRPRSELTDWNELEETAELVTRPINTGKTGQIEKKPSQDTTVTSQAERIYSLFFKEKAYVFTHESKVQRLLANRAELGHGGENVVYKDLLYRETASISTIRRKPHTQKNEEQALCFAEYNKNIRKILKKLKGVQGIVQPTHVLSYSTRGNKVEYTARTIELYPHYSHGDLYSASAGLLINSNKKEAMSQLLNALANLHENQIVHRDIKPENILVNKNTKDSFTLELHDFGFAKDIDPGKVKAIACSEGTLDYLPPEDFINKRQEITVSKSQDLWAMGLVLYETMHDKSRPSYAISETTLDLLYTSNTPELANKALLDYEGRWKEEKNKLEELIENPTTSQDEKLNSQLDLLILKLLHPNPDLRSSAKEALTQLKKIPL